MAAGHPSIEAVAAQFSSADPVGEGHFHPEKSKACAIFQAEKPIARKAENTALAIASQTEICGVIDVPAIRLLH
ncbi:hypothetical protein [Chitinimonas sp.]|uniref:hypothetical protein n=1 Tax=Chitinimonas sp. TaxID=1934313 RepID=UPI0035B3B845